MAYLGDGLLCRESIEAFVSLLTRSQEVFSTSSQQVTVSGQTCLTFSSISVDPGGEDRGSSSFTSAPRAAYSWPCWGRGGETTNQITNRKTTNKKKKPHKQAKRVNVKMKGIIPDPS